MSALDQRLAEVAHLRAMYDAHRALIAEQAAEIGRLRERLDAQIHETERAEAEMLALVAAELLALPHDRVADQPPGSLRRHLQDAP